MTATNHALTGAVISLAVKQPWLAIPLALLSHFAIDALPHWDYAIKRNKPYEEGLFDRNFIRLLSIDLSVTLGFFIGLGLIFPHQKWLIWACMIAAAAPDGMWAYYRIYLPKITHTKPKLNRVAIFHSTIQWSQTPAGGLLEIGWLIAMIAVIINLR